MTFSSTSGSRGAKQPGGVVLRWFNKLAVRRVRKGHGKVSGLNALVLNTVGARSGEPRSTPLGWFPGEDHSWLIVASAAGAAKNPAWYHNLAAHPESVTIDVGGRNVDVVPEQLYGPERERAWQSIVAAAPRYGGYVGKTDRELPVIRLTRLDESAR
jgi:deazaflavin-dependent oxidoreductase (nitroreductase family)